MAVDGSTASVPRVRRVGRLAAAAVVLLTTGSFALNVVSPLRKAAGDDAGLKEIGVMSAALDRTTFPVNPDQGIWPGPLAIDPVNRLGFSAGVGDGSAQYLLMYDLDRRKFVRQAKWDNPLTSDVRQLAFDTSRKRVYSVTVPLGTVQAPCGPSPLQSGTLVQSWDYSGVDASDGESTLVSKTVQLPCSGSQAFVAERAYVDPVHDKLYQAGHYADEHFRVAADGPTGTHNNDGQHLLIRQLDLPKLSADATSVSSLDWEVDLQTAGCGRIVNWLVQRVGNDVLSYCNDAKPATFNLVVGQQGYNIRIPLDDTSMPLTVPAGAPAVPDPTNPLAKDVMNADIRRLPALPGSVEPLADYDPVTQRERLLLATSDAVNGNAVWVYDPAESAQRFVGVITGGNANLPPEQSAAGIDPTTGHVYVMTNKGILLAPIRHDPLPLGAPPYPVVVHDGTEKMSVTGRGQIAVLPATRYPRRPALLFVPVVGKGYVVVEDDVVDPPDPVVPNPDDLTSGAIEDPAKTVANSSGGAVASGVHIVVTGGTKVINNSDPICSPDPTIQRTVSPAGPVVSQLPPEVTATCVADHVFSTGNRETYLGYTEVDAGAAGSNANAAGQTFPSSDQATAADFRNNQISSSGTAGDDGKGFPFPGAQCGDTGDGAKQDRSPQNPMADAAVTCNNSLNASAGRAGFGPLTIPDPTNPEATLFSVARVSSQVSTIKSPLGQVTISEAEASGVRIGPISIAEVVSLATTTAHGRDNTTTTVQYQRQWCGINLDASARPPGFPAQSPGCMNPDDAANQPFIDGLNRLNRLAGRFWLTVPPVFTKATAKGYQAEVRKPDAAAEADQVVNNDGSNTVAAMQAIFYNDGPQGRSRLVVQLAGVQSGSNYGITSLPDFGGGSGGDENPPPVTTPTSLPPVVASADDTTVTTEPPPAASGPESTGSTPTLPSRGASPPVQFVQLGHAQDTAMSVPTPQPGGVVQRIIRLPGEILREALEMLVTKPAQFALLFGLWALLATPVYLAVRRRTLARTLAD